MANGKISGDPIATTAAGVIMAAIQGGVNVQAPSTLFAANELNLSGLADPAQALTNLGGLNAALAASTYLTQVDAASIYLTIAAAGTGFQPLSANLTSWAAVTRATGFDAFVATPSSANLRALLTDETGTGSAYFVGGALGTPASGTATNLTGLPISTGVSGLGSNVATFLATPSSANLRAALTDEVGTGAAYFVGGALGTPASGTATNLTGLPLTTGVTGTLPIGNGGTGQITAGAAFDALAPTTTRGDLIFRNATTNARLAASTAGYLLQTNGAGSDPSWNGFLQSGTGAVTRTWQDKARDSLNLEDFGAKGDLITLDNGASTNGSANFSCAGASFTAADVGKTIAIQAGGAAGVPLLTTIATFVSATAITLATPALNTATTSFYYGTDDTVAVNAALAAAGTSGIPLAVSRRYLVTSLTAAGALSLKGGGENVSQFIFHGATANFTYDAGSVTALPIKTASFKFSDLSFVSGYEKNTATNGLVYANFPNGPYPLEALRGNNAQISTLGLGFGLGWNFNNADALTLVNVGAINGSLVSSHPISGSVGIRIQGNLKPFDAYMLACRVYFSETGIDIVGQANFANVMEGVSIIDCLVIVCDTCIKATSTALLPYLHIEGCNLNGYVTDVAISGAGQCHIVNNLLYAVGDRSGLANWVGIAVNNSLVTASPWLNLFANNVFNAGPAPTLNAVGITFDAVAGANQQTVVDGNTFGSCDTGITLFSGANNIDIKPTNTFPSTPIEVTDSSTTGTNTYYATIPLNAGKQVVVTEQFSLSNADISGVNTTAVQNWFAAAQDTFALKANTTYEFEGKLLVVTTGTNNHAIGLQFGGTATFTDFVYDALATNSSNRTSPSAVTGTEGTTTANVLVTATVAAATQNSIRIKGTMRVSAAGTFIPQFAYNAIPGAVPTILKATHLRIWPKGDGSVVAVGAS